MRRIVQIGTGIRSWINFKEGDIFLGCEPMRSLMEKHDTYYLPPDFVDSYIYEGVICSDKFRGHIDFVVSKNLEVGSQNLGKGFPLDGNRKRPSAYQVIKLPCLTLDELLRKYEAEGFTESIDFFNSSMPLETANDIFSEFSWDVKPKIVALASGNNRTVEILEAQGYDVLKHNHPFLGVFIQ